MKKSIKLCSVKRELFVSLLRDELIRVSQYIPRSLVLLQYRISLRNTIEYFWQWLNEKISYKAFTQKCLQERNSLWTVVDAELGY